MIEKRKNIFQDFCTLEIVWTCTIPNISSKLDWEPFENLRTLFFTWFFHFEHIWLYFGANLDRISRIFMDFPKIAPSSTCSFSTTTGRISKSLVIKHIYSARYVDCATFWADWGRPRGRFEAMNSPTKPVFDFDIPTIGPIPSHRKVPEVYESTGAISRKNRHILQGSLQSRCNSRNHWFWLFFRSLSRGSNFWSRFFLKK
mgnify:CR=1 FL=1